MLHRDLDAPLPAPRTHPLIQQPHVPATHDLPQPAVDRVAHLDEAAALVHEHQVRLPPQRGLLGLAHELHDDGAADVAVLVDVNPHLLEHEQELVVAEAEHAEGPLARDAVLDAGALRRAQVRDREGDLLVERHDLEAARRGNGEAVLEEVDVVRFARDVELIEVAEELSVAFAGEAEAGRGEGARRGGG